MDPLGGSYYVEHLTHSLAVEARQLIEEVDELGGMTKAVESGSPKLRIEEAAARRQARVDRAEDVVVGVNRYHPEDIDEVEILNIDNTAVREAQIARLKAVRASRDKSRCSAALAALTEAAKTDSENLMPLSLEAVRARATVGEISDALEKVYRRHQATVHAISGVYGAAYEGDEAFEQVKQAGRVFRA